MGASVTELLLEQGFINSDQLSAAQSMARTMGEPVLSVLVEQGAVAKRDVVRFTVEAAGMQFVDVLDIDVDMDALALLTGDQARLYQVLPIALEDDVLVVVSDPQTAHNQTVIQDLRAITRHPIRFSCALKSEIRQRISAEYPEEDVTLPSAEDDAAAVVLDALDPAATTPSREFVDALLQDAISKGASDIHLQAIGTAVRVRVRFDGLLLEGKAPPRAIHPAVVYRVKKLAALDPADLSRPQHGKFRFRADGHAVTLRVSTLPTVTGEEIVIRVASPPPAAMSLEGLGFSDDTLSTWRDAIDRSDGLIIVSGPPASGRSTLLYATLTELARPQVSVVTVESHVEYRIPGATQVRIDELGGFGYAAALDSIREADPDIVLIGEVNDRDTIRQAIDFAVERSLVFATVPADDAAGVIGRLVEMGVEPFLVRAALKCTVSQRLVRRLCQSCRRPVDAPVGPPTGETVPHWAHAACFEPIGCPACAETGYHGRMALQEVMPMTAELGNAAMRGASVDEIRVLARRSGMRTLREDGWLKVGQGLTSVEEVLRAVG